MRWNMRTNKRSRLRKMSGAELKEKIEQLKKRKGKYEELIKELKRSGEKQIHSPIRTAERWRSRPKAR